MLLREYVAAKVQSSGQWGSAKAVGVPDDACIPTLRGPGPLGGGGRRTKPGHDVIHLRGRFPSNALNTRRSSGIVVDDIHIQALSGLGSEQNVDETPVKFGSNRAQRPSIRFADESPMEEYRSPSRSDLPNPDASSSQARSNHLNKVKSNFASIITHEDGRPIVTERTSVLGFQSVETAELLVPMRWLEEFQENPQLVIAHMNIIQVFNFPLQSIYGFNHCRDTSNHIPRLSRSLLRCEEV